MVEALNELSPSSKTRAVQAYDCQTRLSSKGGIESRLDKWHAATPSGLAFVFMQAGPRKDQLFTLKKASAIPPPRPCSRSLCKELSRERRGLSRQRMKPCSWLMMTGRGQVSACLTFEGLPLPSFQIPRLTHLNPHCSPLVGPALVQTTSPPATSPGETFFPHHHALPQTEQGPFLNPVLPPIHPCLPPPSEYNQQQAIAPRAPDPVPRTAPAAITGEKPPSPN